MPSMVRSCDNVTAHRSHAYGRWGMFRCPGLSEMAVRNASLHDEITLLRAALHHHQEATAALEPPSDSP